MLKKIYFSLILCSVGFILSSNFASAANWEDTKNTTGPNVYIDMGSIYKYQDSYVYTIKYLKDGKSIYTQLELKQVPKQYNLITMLSVDDSYKDIYEIPKERDYKRLSSDQAIYKSAIKVLASYYVPSCPQEKCVAVAENPYLKISNNSNTNTNSVKEADFGPYMRELQSRIKKNWDPPQSNKSKRVVVMFKIGKDGSLLSSSISKSSGVPNVDQAALTALKQSAPFRPLPAEYKEQSIDIQFTFDYNVTTK